MKRNYVIDLDGTIGGWDTNKYTVKKILAENKDKEVSARINSLGGSLDHGLDIAQQFKDHGKVTAYIYGLTASAATVASLGAKKVAMSKNAFYLIHRVSNYVEFAGTMNEEQIEQIIQELEANKQDNKKIDLVLARMYAEKTKKSIDEIYEIMKKGAWLNADEAKEYGFIDEILDDSEQTVFTNSMKDKFNLAEIPLPPMEPQENEKSDLGKVMDYIDKMFNNNNNPQKNEQKMDTLTNFEHLNATLGVDGFEQNGEFVALTGEQMNAVNEKIDSLTKENEAKTAELAEKENALAELNAKVAELEAEVKRMQDEPGAIDSREFEAEKEDEQENDHVANARKMFEDLKNF